LERSSAGEFGNEAGGALGTGSGKRSKDLPSSSAFWGFVTARDFACDHRRTQLAFGQVISGLNAVVIQKGKQMGALLLQTVAHGFFAWFAAGRVQQLDRFAFQGLAQVLEALWITLESPPALNCRLKQSRKIMQVFRIETPLALLRSAAKARARGPSWTPAAPVASDICSGWLERTF
jgi:hypothetical protein